MRAARTLPARLARTALPAAAALLMLAEIAAAAAATAPATREMPCPDAPPRFDCAAIRRDLKEPRYGSARPLYRFLALGPEGKTIVAMVADESKGQGTGVDTLYVDLAGDGDITQPGDKFTVPNSRPPTKPAATDPPGMARLTLGAWGQKVVPETRLAVPDPALEYRLIVENGMTKVIVSTADGFWRVPLRIMDDTLWSASRQDAPVFRIGGPEFQLKNESFVEVPKQRGTAFVSGVGRHLAPGAKISVDATTPFFAGSSPAAQAGWIYVESGHRTLRAWIESVEDPARPAVAEIILRDY